MSFIKNKIGIIGCGHLGLAFAQAFSRKGIGKNNLRISYSGNPKTLARIEKAGLQSCIYPNKEILTDCDFIFLLIRPNQIDTIEVDVINKKAVIVSCMAGLPIEDLQKKFGLPVVRIMPTNPKSIVAGTGMYGMFPGNDSVVKLLNLLELPSMILVSEESFPSFTTLTCLLTLLLYNEVYNIASLSNDEIYDKDFMDFKKFIDWTLEHVPSHLSLQEKENFLKSAATPGGVTEVVLQEFQKTRILSLALKAGIHKAQMLSEGNNKCIK